jgi:uncharacterized DUF497 family protein
LAEKAGVSVSTVKRAQEDVPNIKASNLAKIERALEDGGVRPREAVPLFVAFTMRERSGQLMIRPVSARYMHAKEIANYEAQRS